MGNYFHFNISVEGKIYKFDLIAKNNDLSSGYKVIPADKRDLPIIQRLLKTAQTKEILTIDALANRLKQLDVKTTPVARTHTVSIPTILGQKTTTKLSNNPLEEFAKTLAAPLKTTCPEGAGSIVMISHPNKGSICVSAGTRSVKGEELNSQTAAMIGSGTKMFTSLCSMVLINKGAVNKKGEPPRPLTLDTKVADVFSKKQMLIFDDQAKAKKLTLGMLLSHGGGLVYFANDNQDEREGMSLSNILDTMKPGSVKFYGYPGDGIYSYSNHIGLAAAMLEIACEKPYEEILQEVLLIPLDMNRTSYDCPKDDNILLAYLPASPSQGRASPSSAKKEIRDPMMQGAGGLWSCMDDMAKLGNALGKALSKKGDLIGKNGQTIISKKNLKNMIRPHTINAPCGLVFDLEGDLVGKGGGIHGYDFKFKIDTKSGNCVSTICNHARQGDFDRYLETTYTILRELNPKLSFPKIPKTSPKHKKIAELLIEECPQQFKGFTGYLALPEERPLTRINFNGTTLPIKQLPVTSKGLTKRDVKGLTERYIVEGDSPFQGKEFQIYQQNHHLYPCLSDELEVWSFGEISTAKFPVIKPSVLFKQLERASGDYIDTTPGGPPPFQIRVDPKQGLTLSFPGKPPTKCLIIAQSSTEVSFTACLDDGPPCFSYKLTKAKISDEWKLTILNVETEDPICQLPQTKI